MRRGRTERVTHVVQAVEGRDEVEVARLDGLRAEDLEGNRSPTPAAAARSRATSIEPRW